MFEEEIMAGKWVHLTEYEPEENAAAEAAWTRDVRYRLLMEFDHPREYTPAEIKKHYETGLEESNTSRRQFYFALRANMDNRLTGVFTIPGIEWSNRVAQIRLAFGDPLDLQNWGDDAFRLVLGYMFGELNLHQVVIHIPQFYPEMVEAAEAAGLKLTVRRREAAYYNGRYWDDLHFTILRPDWLALKKGGRA